MVDVPFGTPFKSKADGKARYNNFEPVALDNRFEHCEDMAGMMMGPMPPDNFVDEFMQVDEELPPAPNVTFEDVPTNSEAKNEAEMYPWLVRDFQQCCPRFQWFVSAKDSGTSGVKIRPDLGIIECDRWDGGPTTPQAPPPPEHTEPAAPLPQPSTPPHASPQLPALPTSPSSPSPQFTSSSPQHEQTGDERQSVTGEVFSAVQDADGQLDVDASPSPSPQPLPLQPLPSQPQQPRQSQRQNIPNVPVVPRDTPFDWTRCEFSCEVKRKSSDDAFDDKNVKTVEALTNVGRRHRGQLFSYLKDQSSRQHRTRTFQLFIFGDWARFLCYDQSAGIVTEKFNYKDNPKLLVKFLWRYSHMTQQQRGWDPTVVLATPAETALFNAEMKPRIDRISGRPEDDLRGGLKGEKFGLTLDTQYPTYKIHITSPNYSTDLLIRRPFFEPFSVCGRATRGYLAYDVANNDIVFLKDTWRTDSSDRRTESEIYDYLKSFGVEHLPEVLYASDVKTPTGNAQETFIDAFMRRVQSWARPCANTRSHVHCRIVQKVAFPLASFRWSKEFVQVLRDALVAIKQAHDHGILYRDISFGNIMISSDGRGILNDWDHSRGVPSPEDERKPNGGPPFRTGTWQFMSINQLSDSERHTRLCTAFIKQG